MPSTLPPTVHERLARCGERVFVDGLVAGATVELHVDATVFATSVAGGRHTFTVPSLSAGSVVRARQDPGSGFSSFSPAVLVEDAFVPPEAAPSLPEEVGACSQCVLVSHATPGSRIELSVAETLVGGGVADRHGNACVGVDLRPLRGRPGAILSARQVVCGDPGPTASRTLVSLPPLPRPQIGEPVFGCQNRVPVSNARAGARLTFETDGGDDLGSVCSCWKGVNVFLIRSLAVGEQVRTRCLYNTEPCEDSGPWSAWRRVEPPDERIRPEVLEPLIEGDQLIRVTNQIAGASLTIRIAESEGSAPDEFGPRPASEEPEIALAGPLAAGNVVTVVQTLCGFSVESEPVTVQPPPPVIHAPVIVPPLYACGQAVQVSNLHPGAVVRVFMDGIPIGLRWAGLENSVAVPAAPALVAGRKVTARQQVGGTASPESVPVDVQPFPTLVSPRLLGPLALGDQAVWVSGVTPGARVAIVSSGLVVGEADAAEPVVRVPIGPLPLSPATGAAPRVRLCDRSLTGQGLPAVVSPCEALFDREVVDKAVDLGDYAVPPVRDGGDFSIRLRGQLYGASPPILRRSPLVVIAHGWHLGYNQHTGDPVESFKGYAYLARHLVRWGMLVFSIDLQEVNDRNLGHGTLEQFARSEIILEAIARLQASSLLQGAIRPGRIGLVGHSMGGEAVVVAQFLNESESRGFGIRGVVSIAPTRWHPDIVYPEGRYMQLYGSLDQLTGVLPSGDTAGAGGGMRIYDRAQRNKTLFWIHGLSHNPFNSLWVPAGDFAEEHLRDLALPEGEHERAAKCLINAFFQEALFDRTEYRSYMEGTVFPQSLRHLSIHTSHSRQPVAVVDNFGDPDEQAGVPAETPLDKTVNSRSEAVSASGAGLVDWEDEQHTSIPNSPHTTAGVRLSWDAPDAEYRSETGGIAGAAQDALALRIAQLFRDDALNPEALPADFFVVLSDGTEEAIVRLGAVAQAPYPDATPRVLSTMRTVRLPLDAFQAANPALNLADIRSVTARLVARPTGHVLMDDLEVGA